MSDSEAILRWLAVLGLISFAIAPVVWWLGEGLEGARYGLTRPLAIVVMTAVLWWPAALFGIPFVQVTLVIVTLMLGLGGWFWWWRGAREIDFRAVIVFEVLWIVLFLGYALFRSYHPDIANTEKPMEIALLSSVSRSGDVPAPDPWLAGEAINYYYFGYQVIGALVKLSGVPPAIAFNLALATLFASLGTAAAAIGYRLAQASGLRRTYSAIAGAFAIFFLILAGNLETALRLVQNPGDTLATGWWYDDIGWQASRIIVDHGVHGSPFPSQTINEFPAFSFILGDLHPHVLTYPLVLAIAALVLGMVLVPTTITHVRVSILGSLIGLLYVSNSWDAPLGFLLLAGGMLAALGVRQRRAWLQLGLAAFAAIATALPFLLHFTAPVGVQPAELPAPVRSIPLLSNLLRTLGIVTWRPSSATELLTVHGHWCVAFALFALFALTTESRLHHAIRRRFDVMAVLLPVVLVLGVLWVPALIVLGVPLVVAGAIVVTDTRMSIRAIAGLFSFGFLLTLVPEFVYIQDAFADRMNTVFKLYFQAWLVFSIATATGLAIVVSQTTRRWLVANLLITSALILGVAPYTPLSARDWTTDFAERQGLNGATYIERVNPDEAAAIAWIRQHIPDGSTIVEGPGCSYGTFAGIPMNRMSAFTGVPTFVGWAGHEEQWRRGEDEPIGLRITNRQSMANRWLSGEIAMSPDLPNPDFVILGTLEESGSADCEPLLAHDVTTTVNRLTNAGWRPVFTSENVVILAENTSEPAGIVD